MTKQDDFFENIKEDCKKVVYEEDADRELMRYFAGVASLFGAEVCVEGVETARMRDILQRFAVESFQGYYYAKPLGLDDILKWKPKA